MGVSGVSGRREQVLAGVAGGGGGRSRGPVRGIRHRQEGSKLCIQVATLGELLDEEAITLLVVN